MTNPDLLPICGFFLTVSLHPDKISDPHLISFTPAPTLLTIDATHMRRYNLATKPEKEIKLHHPTEVKILQWELEISLIIIMGVVFQRIFLGVRRIWIVPGMDLSGTWTKYDASWTEPADCNVPVKLSKVQSCETSCLCSSFCRAWE